MVLLSGSTPSASACSYTSSARPWSAALAHAWISALVTCALVHQHRKPHPPAVRSHVVRGVTLFWLLYADRSRETLTQK